MKNRKKNVGWLLAAAALTLLSIPTKAEAKDPFGWAANQAAANMYLQQQAGYNPYLNYNYNNGYGYGYNGMNNFYSNTPYGYNGYGNVYGNPYASPYRQKYGNRNINLRRILNNVL